MTQPETAEKAAVARLLAAVDNLNACWDEIHRMGMVVQVNSPAVEIPQANGQKLLTIRTQAKVFRVIG